MKSFIAPGACWKCGGRFDETSDVLDHHAQPKPGDVAVCLYCAALSVFDGQLIHRRPTADESNEFGSNPNVRRMQLAVRFLNVPERKRHNRG